MWVIKHNTTKYQCSYGSSGDLYYTKTLIKFKKTSDSPPIFVYFTAHFDDNAGDLNTYPKEFKNQVYIVAYGIVRLTDHVDPEVYDAHEAFEIDKTKMKMLVPLDMNNQRIMNTNFDLKFGDLFKIFSIVYYIIILHPVKMFIKYYVKEIIIFLCLSIFQFQLFYIHLFYHHLILNFMIKHL